MKRDDCDESRGRVNTVQCEYKCFVFVNLEAVGFEELSPSVTGSSL